MSLPRSETCTSVLLAIAPAACRGDGGGSTASHVGRENPKEHEMARSLARLAPLAAPGAPAAEARR